MLSLPRPAAAMAALSRARRGPLPLLGAELISLPPQHTPQQTRAPARPSAQRLAVCRLCHQIRCYSSITVPSTPATATARPQDEGTGSRILKTSEPLRILFCGSDEFSCAALKALNHEHERNPDLVQSIDVVARPGKRVGRGYKVIQHPPIRELATELGLPVHERDTFRGWDMPPHINLIIAVSFGLFVPARLLQAARFGGLNLHPSALPDLRGPAPLQHALLGGRTATAVSLQTLDHLAFDRGLVLARSGTIRIPSDATFESLRDLVAPRAAALLVRGLREGVHVPPLLEIEVDGEVKGEDLRKGEGTEEAAKLLHAPKITKEDRRVRPEHVPHLWLRYRALGPLWFYSRDRKGARKRVIIEKMSMPPREHHHDVSDAASTSSFSPSTPIAYECTIVDADRPVFRHGDVDDGGDRWSYLVPLELEEPDPDAGSDVGSNNSNSRNDEAVVRPKSQTTKYLMFYVSKNDYGLAGACWLGNCRIETVKVEGERAKPAAQALKDFLVPWSSAPNSCRSFERPAVEARKIER